MKVCFSRKIKINTETPIFMMLIGLLLIQIASPLRIESIVSIGTWTIVISTMAAFITSVIRRKISNRYLLSLIMLGSSVFISMLSSFSWNYRNLVVAFSFLEIPLLMVSYSGMYRKDIRKAIFWCFFILSIYYNLLSLTSIANIYYTEYGSRQMHFLTLGYNNPNETAMYLFASLIVLVALYGEVKKRLFRILLAFDIGLVVRLIFLTLSRTGILMVAIFLVLTVLFWKRKIPDYVRIFCFMTPVFFLIITFVIRKLGNDFVFLGESVETGRFELYNSVLEQLDLLSFFVGKYSFRFENLHNAIWTIFSTIGIVGVITFFLLINTKIQEIQNCVKDKCASKIALIGLLCIVVYTSTEAALLTVGGSFAAIVVSIYLISIYDGLQSI